MNEYKTKTGIDLRNDPLGKELQSCESAEAVLGIIQRHAKAFDKFRDGDTIVPVPMQIPCCLQISKVDSRSPLYRHPFHLKKLLYVL